MTGRHGIHAIGMVILIAGLAGCQDSPTISATRDHTPLPLFDLVVLNGTATDVTFYVQYRVASGDDGIGGAGEVVGLGRVARFAEERFVLEPSLVRDAPARFFAMSRTDDEMIESDWLWVNDGRPIELLITPLRVIRSDDPGLDIHEVCPGAGEGLCR